VAIRLPFKGIFAGKPWLPAVIAGVLAFTLVMLILLVLRPAPKYQAYLMLKDGKVLTRGQALSDDAIGTVSLPADAALARRAIPDTPTDRQTIKDRRISHELAGGNLLLFQDFSESGTGASERIDPDMRALSIPVSAPTSVANLVEPGSLVDVLAVIDIMPKDQPPPSPGQPAPRPEPVARTILQAVRVVAVGAMVAPSPYVNPAERGYATVTLELTPEQVAHTVEALALARGGLVLALRNPKKTDPGAPVAEVTAATMRANANAKGR
jgi:pilus assembly protein CpaB